MERNMFCFYAQSTSEWKIARKMQCTHQTNTGHGPYNMKLNENPSARAESNDVSK